MLQRLFCARSLFALRSTRSFSKNPWAQASPIEAKRDPTPVPDNESGEPNQTSAEKLSAALKRVSYEDVAQACASEGWICFCRLCFLSLHACGHRDETTVIFSLFSHSSSLSHSSSPSRSRSRSPAPLLCRQAYKRIRGTVRKTPCDYSQALSELTGCHLYIKKEHISMTGAVCTSSSAAYCRLHGVALLPSCSTRTLSC